MITDRDTDRILRSWFQEGVGGLPDRVLDSVVEGLPRVRQRRRPWVLPGSAGGASPGSGSQSSPLRSSRC